MACCLTAKKKKRKLTKNWDWFLTTKFQSNEKKKGTRKIPHDTKTRTNKQAKKKIHVHAQTHTHIYIERECMYLFLYQPYLYY